MSRRIRWSQLTVQERAEILHQATEAVSRVGRDDTRPIVHSIRVRRDGSWTLFCGDRTSWAEVRVRPVTVEVTTPADPRPRHRARIRVMAACALCGADLHTEIGQWRAPSRASRQIGRREE